MDSGINLKKITAIILFCAIIGIAGYSLFFGAEDIPTGFDEFGNPLGSKLVGEDLIVLLEKLEAVRFNPALFKMPSFISLTNYSINLGVQAQGRANPFDAIGR